MDHIAYRGPEGRVYRETLYAGAQFRAVRQTTRGPKARWFATERGAIAWLQKVAKGRAS